MLERVAQTPLVSSGTYDMYNSYDTVSHRSDNMIHGRNKNLDAQSHNQKWRAQIIVFGGFRVRI